MGIDRKVSKEAHHVVMAPQPSVLPGDDINLDRVTLALNILRKRENVKLRRVTRFETHFSDNGDIVFRVHSAVDGSFNAVVLAKDMELQDFKGLADPEK